MSEKVLTNLIAGGTGLVGALIGFFGAWLVSRQTRKAAIEQIRYARAHERRDEVLATLYGLLNEVDWDFRRLLRLAERRQDQDLVDQAKQLNAKLLEFTSYLLRHDVWLSTRLSSKFLSAVEALTDRFTDLANVLEDSNSALYDETIKQIDEWRSKEVNRDLVELGYQIQHTLGVEDSL